MLQSVNFTLYPDQKTNVFKLHEKVEEGKNVILVCPTGAGKTVMMSQFVLDLMNKGLVTLDKPALFLVHRKELLDQTSKTLVKCGVPPKVIAAGVLDQLHKSPFIVASIQTLVARKHTLDSLRHNVSLVITDECHHARAKSYEDLYNGTFEGRQRIGMTATPLRLDGKSLGMYYDDMVVGLGTKELIDMGRLCPFECLAHTSIFDRSLLKESKTTGEYTPSSVKEAMKNPSKGIGNIVEAVSQVIDKDDGTKRRILIFSPDIETSKLVNQKLYSAGHKSRHIDGETDNLLRKSHLEMWQKGQVDIVTNVALFSEGMDAPECDCVIDAKPTKSLTVYLQKMGRALRYGEGKTALFVDLCGNISEHGKPDRHRDWTLAGKDREKRKPRALRLLTCTNPECAGIFPYKADRVCPFCGHVATKESVEYKQEDGILVPIEPSEGLSNLETARKVRMERYSKLLQLGKVETARWQAKMWRENEIIDRLQKQVKGAML